MRRSWRRPAIRCRSLGNCSAIRRPPQRRDTRTYKTIHCGSTGASARSSPGQQPRRRDCRPPAENDVSDAKKTDELAEFIAHLGEFYRSRPNGRRELIELREFVRRTAKSEPDEEESRLRISKLNRDLTIVRAIKKLRDDRGIPPKRNPARRNKKYKPSGCAIVGDSFAVLEPT